MSQSFRVAVEGNIGVGKSTLLPALAESLPGNWNVLDERVDEDAEFKKLLGDFYLDSNKQVNLQSWITNRRLKDFHAIADCPDNYLFERSFLGEMVFCHANLMRHEKPDGSFISFFYQIINALKQCRYDAVIYLKAHPETCFERIKARARDGEANKICYDYVKHLHNCYETHLQEASRVYNIPLIQVNWDTFDAIENVSAQVSRALGLQQLEHPIKKAMPA